MSSSHEEIRMVQDMYVDGAWATSSGAARLQVVNPATEEPIADVTEGAAADVDIAVSAARLAFADWAETSPATRGSLVAALADEIERRTDHFTDLVVSEIGAPRRIARWLHVGFGVIDLRTSVDGLEEIRWEERVGTSVVIREPIGVVGAITPWNYPLHQITAKVGSALVAGCTVVLKPSEAAPLTAQAFAEAVDAVGFPRGVFNLVNGTGPIVGEAIVAHADVDMVSFTGSSAVGKRVAALAADTVKRVALELGGKSASVVLDDADLDLAVKGTIRGSYANAGQSCNALSRMLVPRHLMQEAESLARKYAEGYTLGDPLDDNTKLGPIVNEKQRARVREFIEGARAQGARLVTGGKDVDRPGYFVEPTVFSDVRPEMTIAQEEVFGPVLVIIPYDDEDEAVAIANGTVYGLAGAVWSGDPERARRVATRLRAAQVGINGGEFNPKAPFGGYKQSGLGRENGAFGIEEFLEIKSLQL